MVNTYERFEFVFPCKSYTRSSRLYRLRLRLIPNWGAYDLFEDVALMISLVANWVEKDLSPVVVVSF